MKRAHSEQTFFVRPFKSQLDDFGIFPTLGHLREQSRLRFDLNKRYATGLRALVDVVERHWWYISKPCWLAE